MTPPNSHRPSQRSEALGPPTPDVRQQPALLWDLDNVTAGVTSDAALALQIISRCDGSTLLFAAGHRATFLSHWETLTSMGIALLSGGRGPHGADRRLMERGRALHRQGVTHFIVASNDRAFAHLPGSCTLTVLTLTPELLSRRLARRAQHVHTLYRPQLDQAERQ